MIIQPTSLAALTWAGAAAGSSAESWRIGAVLAARPLGLNDRGLLVLEIGGLTVEAEPPPGQQLANGQLPPQFQVRVQSLGGQPLLEILGTGGSDPIVYRALRERLPQQNGYAPLLSTLDALSRRPQLRQLPDPLREALAVLDHAVRLPEEITRGEGLREAIARSGLFLEAQLAQPRTDLAALATDDWKAALLRLAATLEPHAPARPPARGAETPPPLQQRGLQPPQARQPTPLELLESEGIDALIERLHGDVRAALARLEVAQLDNTQATAWMIEIPVQGEGGRDVLQLHLAFGRAEEGSGAWTLGFSIDLPPLGPVQGELHLRDLRLGVRLWAERGDTVERLERQFPALRQRLAACGLLLDQLSCQTGLPHGPQRAGGLLFKATA